MILKNQKQYWVYDADGELWDVSISRKRGYASNTFGMVGESEILEDGEVLIDECIEKKMSIWDWLQEQGYKNIRYDPRGQDILFFNLV